jgi:hypothetical protein
MAEYSYPFTAAHLRMIDCRAAHGFNVTESAELLDELLHAHTDDNLAVALAYNGFTDQDARR